MVLENYTTKEATVCSLGGMSDIIRYLGIDISEEWLLGTCSSLKFCYGYVEKNNKKHWCKKNSMSDIYFYCTDIYYELEVYSRILNEIGICLEEEFGEDEETSLANIGSLISQRIPILIEIDTYYMSYHINYRKKHQAHAIVVYGIDKSENKCYVADNYITTLIKSSYMGQISYDEFVKGINLSEVFADHKYIHWRITKNRVISRNIENNIKSSIDIAEYEMRKRKSIDNERCFGITGIKQFQYNINEFLNCDFNGEVEYQLRNINCFITGYGGPIPTRTLYSKFIYTGLNNGNIQNISTAISNLEETIKQWTIVANIITRCIFLKDTSGLKKVVDRTEYVIELEDKVIDALKKCIG